MSQNQGSGSDTDSLVSNCQSSFPPCHEQYEEKNVSQLQDVSLLMNEFYGMIDISPWLMTTISTKRSTHSESSLLQVSST